MLRLAAPQIQQVARLTFTTVVDNTPMALVTCAYKAMKCAKYRSAAEQVRPQFQPGWPFPRVLLTDAVPAAEPTALVPVAMIDT
ncbi:MAG: hypothetical protein ABWY82_06665, partial [Tardiphaga sp.]